MEILLIILAVVVVIALWGVGVYNGLVKARNAVKDQWSQIDVLLKRRFDLIPNLVETVKGYANHEKDTLDAVVNARAKAISATTPAEEMKANAELSNALSRLVAISEAYPDLKANTNFLDLQNQLKETEDKIAYARQFYNDAVLGYNNKLEVFPSSIIASMFHFVKEAFFEANETEKVAPQVKF